MKRILCVLLLCLLSMSMGAYAGIGSASTETPLTLEQAIQLALKQSPEILMAKGKLEEAQGEKEQAGAKLLPHLALHGFLDTGDTSTMLDTTSSVEPMGWIMSNPTKGGNFGGVVSFSYPIFTSGYLNEALESASFRQDSQKESLAMAKLNVTTEVTVAYDAVLEAEENLKASQENLKEANEIRHLADKNYKAGTAPYFYLLRAQSLFSESQEKFAQAKNDLQILKVQLTSVLGESSSKIFSLSGCLKTSFPPLPSFDSVLETAYENRPDIKSVQAQVKEYAARAKSMAGSLGPQVYFFSRYDAVSNETPGAFNGYNVGIHASFPIFDGGGREGKIKEAKGELKEAQAHLLTLTLQIKNQTAKAYYDFQSALREIVSAQDEVKSAAENLRIAMLRFQTGKGIFLEILDAQKALSDARYRYAKALFDANVSYVFLKRAEGITIYTDKNP
jgi:outer membrane protein